jgi:23S rRNA (cytosine1962-C5)-methyltransferase
VGPVLELPAFLESVLGRGHPWVYRDHVPARFAAPDGAAVRIRAGRFEAWALWDRRSPIALRVVGAEPPDAAWVEARVRDSWALRAPLRERSQRTSAYRWIFGEGDGLPGVVVDLYGRFAVVAVYADGLEVLVPWVLAALRRTTDLHGIVRRGRGRAVPSVVWGRAPPRELIVEQEGLRLRADLLHGQKTGLFLDQRENRRTLERLAAGRRVLDLFAYSGGFALAALRGGAAQATLVDAAPGALADAAANLALNGFDPEAHAFENADVFAWLARARAEQRRFDLVIADPPSFARSRGQHDRALAAYARLHAAALAVTEPGGWYAAASCTAQVSPEQLKDTLAEGARRAGRRLQIVHEAGHALDHPVLPGHPEGRYLKLVVGRAP